MPKFLHLINKLFKAIDLFPTTNFLRYNSEPEYTSATGGIISALILVIFVALFASMGFRTINRQIIISTVSTQYNVDPPPITFNTNLQNNNGFLFLIKPAGFPLTNPNEKYFHITMNTDFYRNLQFQNTTEVPLIPCTKEHFNITPQLMKIYDTQNLSQALCPPKDYNFTVTGKSSSQIWGAIRINIFKCNNTIDSTCVNDTAFSAVQQILGQFMASFNVVHPYINAGQQNYKQYYYDDKNFMNFGLNLGAGIYTYLHEDIVETDISLLPTSDIVTEKIPRAPQPAKQLNFVPTPQQLLAQFYIMRAGQTITYTRQFNKIDNYFSYVGGLIGTIIGLIFILGKYNQKAYEASIAHKIFKYSDDKPINSRGFNLFYFILMPIKNIFNYFDCNLNWEKTQTYLEVTDEASNQLDITYILRKLNFIDSAISKLMEEHQVQTIYMRDKPTLEAAKRSEKQSQFEELSALQLSNRNQDLCQLHRAAAEVYKESKNGKQISRKIINELNPNLIKNIVAENESINDLRQNVIQIKPKKTPSYRNSKRQQQNKEEKGSEFQYIYPRQQ